MLAGRDPLPHRRQVQSIARAAEEAGIQNRFVLGRKTLCMKFQWSSSAA
jgi:hypothetical protein